MTSHQTKDYHSNWDDKKIVQHFLSSRNKEEDLYPSEKYFLDKFLTKEMRVLDYGCAAGGFVDILSKRYQLPEINYWGVDISPQMIRVAESAHPQSHFELGLSKIQSAGERFDLIYSFGTFHMTFDWRVILKNLYLISRQYLIFDVRLTKTGKTVEDISQSYQKLNFFNEELDTGDVPYIILNEEEFYTYLQSVIEENDEVLTHGYEHSVSHSVTSLYQKIDMMSICVIKKTNSLNG
ncbi:MAG: class I SAM-dependent methyltransferase [SAR324 cluster bacterium]|nr:class I SAM-dependent methyltransferase [SAR324 cluster bacterium]